jgi:hypothetical protein
MLKAALIKVTLYPFMAGRVFFYLTRGPSPEKGEG